MMYISRRGLPMLGHILRVSRVLCLTCSGGYIVIHSIYDCFGACDVDRGMLMVYIHSFCDNFTGVNDQIISLRRISDMFSEKQMTIWRKLSELVRRAATARFAILDIIWNTNTV